MVISLNTPQRCTALTNVRDFRLSRPQECVTGFTGGVLPPQPGGDMLYETPGGIMQYEDTQNMEYESA